MGLDVRKTRDMSAPVTEGKHYRLLCLTGDSKGISYYMMGKRVVMGRDESAGITIYDQKASREHLELIIKRGEVFLTDLDSQNGVIVNDLAVTQYKLKENDKIIIGQTIYKYNFFEVGAAENGENEGEDETSKKRSKRKPTKKQPPNKKKLFLVAAIVVLGILMFDGPPKKKVEKRVKTSANKIDNLTKILKTKKQKEDREHIKKINAIIHRGQREFREGNYFRAIDEFELALLLSPNNGRASFYKRKSQQRLDEEIGKSFLKGRQEMESLKFEHAMKTYCTVAKLLINYKEDQRYKDAINNLKIVENKMGMLEGDLNCD